MGSTYSSDTFDAEGNMTTGHLLVQKVQIGLEYDAGYKSVGTILHSAILVFGVLGNCLVAAVVLKKRFLQTPVNYYIVSLAAADILVLISSIPEAVSGYFRPSHIWVLGDIGCKSLIYFQYLGINVSSASMIAFTLERYLAVCRPRVMQDGQASISKVRRVIVAIWICVIVYCSPWLWLMETVTIENDVEGYPNARVCTKLQENDTEAYVYKTVFVADLLLFYIVPLTICIILYAKMGLVLYKSIRGAGRKESRARSVSDPGDSIELYSTMRLGSTSIVTDRARKIVRSRIQVVRMLGLVVLLFAVLTLPYRSIMVYNSFAAKTYSEKWALLAAKTCTFLNSAINPLLYNFMSSRFRMAFRGVLCERPVVTTKHRPLML